jgi:GT2 family glycosyltransferase/glycosyltransferase involved in cell wall biosynthesis
LSVQVNPSYWLKGELTQNFGDYLTELFLENLFFNVNIECEALWIIGSCINDYQVSLSVKDEGDRVVFWGCGLREEVNLSPKARKASRILSVRGPLSRSTLRLGDTTPIGDPGLLMPAIYLPKRVLRLKNHSLIVPHFHDQRSDNELLKLTGCDRALRPNIRNDKNSAYEFIDSLTSAGFVLCGSLHAAVLAVAYGIPFGFWDSGNVDLPFKWKDFAASLGIPCEFSADIKAAEIFYNKSICRSLKIPVLWPMLVAAPFPVRPEVISKVIELDCQRYGTKAFDSPMPKSTSTEIAFNLQYAMESIELMKVQVSDRDNQISVLNQSVSDRDNQISVLNQSVSDRDNQISVLNQSVSDRDNQISVLDVKLNELKTRIANIECSRSWKITAPYRWVGDFIKMPIIKLLKRGFLSRTIIAVMLLPSALVFYGGILPTIRRLRSGKGAFAEVIAKQGVLHESLTSSPMLLRKIVFLSFSLAIRIQGAGSVVRSFRNFMRVISQDGWRGFYFRILTSVPKEIYGGEASSSAFVELKPEVARKILVADYRVPRADVSAGERATVGILQDLCLLGYEVTFLANYIEPSSKYEDELRILGVHVVTRDSGFEHSAHYLEQHGCDFGIFYLIRVDVAENLLPIARKVAPNSIIIFHAPDLYFLRESREADLLNDDALRRRALETRDREVSIMSQSDRIVVVSEAEKAVLSDILPNAPISVFPALYTPIVDHSSPYSKRKNIFFLGGFGHSPNVNAVKWFANEVWPHVHKALPNVEFHIIGAEAPDSVVNLSKIPGIKVIGFIPKIDNLLDKFRVGVAPLLYGAGIKGKVAMTMGAGIPCVCTKIAAEGMGIENNIHALIENDPESFADAIIALYGDAEKWARIARNGQTLVREKYGIDSNRTSLLKVLNDGKALPVVQFIQYCQSAKPLSLVSNEGDIDVSIIIPVYNKWTLTRACINSVIQTTLTYGIRYELILADDGSTDETVHAAKIFPGLRVVKTQKNLGFLRNCNNAAKLAHGRHILLLNNDTIVLPGWLESLYKKIQDDDSIAIVGSKLLYRDGVIQEAGAALFNDGTAINVGRGYNRYDEMFNFSREVDYISGASILIRKKFWDSVGGFDERYKDAYCEDCDLAMTARSLGMKVIYEPLSEVVHFEHQSYEDQAPSHNSTLQTHNTEIMLQKWSEVFKKNHLPVCDWHKASANAERTLTLDSIKRIKSNCLNVLYFSPFPSHPPSHGNRSTILQFGKYFQKAGHKVHFVLLKSNEYSYEDEIIMQKEWDSLNLLPFNHPMIADGKDVEFDGWYEEGLGERVRVICAKYEIDVVLCSYVFQSKILEYIPSRIFKVIDTHDKMGERYEMLRSNGQPLEFFSCSPEEEGMYLNRADIIVAKRQEEASYFNAITGRNSAIVIPHLEKPSFLKRKYTSLNKLGLVASSNRINLATIREFLEVLDRNLAGNNPPFIIHIAGQVRDMVQYLSDEESKIFKKSWVKMLGFVDDIGEFYSSVDLVVCPVTMGTGINIKTLQAMAYGVPVLSTVFASKGIDTTYQMHLHSDIGSVVKSIFEISTSPSDLDKLAQESRFVYKSFYKNAISGFDALEDCIKSHREGLYKF